MSKYVANYAQYRFTVYLHMHYSTLVRKHSDLKEVRDHRIRLPPHCVWLHHPPTVGDLSRI